VTEILGFTPDGEGEHDFLWVEKEGQNTAWVAGALAGFAGIRVGDVGFAGLKDRHAVARQWFSVRRPAGDKADWSRCDVAGIHILEVTRHGRKLRRGAHRGNHFRLALRGTGDISGVVIDQLKAVREQGVPNYFGEQRFGHGARNLEMARQLFAGRRLPRNRKSLALSAARSFLFNCVLDRRVADGTWDRLIPGDSANLDGSGSLFHVESVDDELQRRAEELDLHPTGALWGSGNSPVSGDVLELERAVAAANAGLAGGLEAQRVARARRSLRVRVNEFTWVAEDERTLWLDFSLTRGAFATAVLRELVQAPPTAGAEP